MVSLPIGQQIPFTEPEGHNLEEVLVLVVAGEGRSMAELNDGPTTRPPSVNCTT